MRKKKQLQWIVALLALTNVVACGNTKTADTGLDNLFADVQFNGDSQFGDTGKKPDVSSDTGTPGSDTVSDSGVSDADDPGSDVDSTTDIATGSDEATGTDTSVDQEIAGSDVANTGCEFVANPLAGEPGATCTSSTDCDSGYCVDSPNGKICTQPCSACCPTGFHCGQIPGSSDTAFVCLAQFIALCRPCNTDAECGAVNVGSLCVSAGDSGSFCGGACDKDSDCPGGYACKLSQGEKGAGNQCVLTSGECGCSKKSIFDGAATACASSNAFGSCSGSRKCAISGLTPCSATTPQQELCNGKDDNCDGLTDGGDSADCVNYWKDGDGDGAGVGTSQCLCAAVGLATATTNGDCDDDLKAIHPGAKEVCDDVDNNCDGTIDEGCDDDGDGYCDAALIIVGSPVVCTYGTKDCNDTVATVHPSAPEICGNGVDDDCNGTIDDNASTLFYLDNDADGFGNNKITQQACAKPAGYVLLGGDCDDNATTVHPGGTEVCDGLDNDCDGLTDGVDLTGCTLFYTDADGDTYGAGTGSCLCKANSTFSVATNGDCNDDNSGTHPGAVEVCDSTDNNCNGVVDEEGANGCGLLYPDEDGDTYGAVTTGHCLCAADGVNKATKSGDCNDTNPSIHPKADEICNGADDNCDGQVDPVGSEGCSNYYLDVDTDGYGVGSVGSKCQCAATGQYSSLLTGDCDDTDSATFPGATEVCNGNDDNCNGDVDEGVTTTYYTDKDKDGYGAASVFVAACSAPPGFVTDNTDCDGSKASVHPGATEACNTVDDNCDGQTDEGAATGCTTFYADADKDSFGDVNTPSQCLCAASGAFTAAAATDCNDGSASVHPGAAEICNGADDNCNGATDEGVGNTYYQDNDSDGYGSAVTLNACGATLGYVLTTGDCNDAVGSIHPNAVETCNGADDNCDGQTDEGVKKSWYEDFDGDGYGNKNVTQTACNAPGGYVADKTDCDDVHAYAHPNAAETCNYVDDNCNGSTDENVTTTYYEDKDGDTYGNPNVSLKACDTAPLGYTSASGDCNDTIATGNPIHPGVQEVCDGVDNNCVGGIDEGVKFTYYQDNDGDGYGSAVTQLACSKPNNYSTFNGDCNDVLANGGAAIYPNQTEACNGIDDNCNGTTDETFTFTTYYQDADLDGYGNPAVSKSACSQPGGYILEHTDCDDAHATAHPGGTEACGAGNAPNGIDENCNGVVDEWCTVAQCTGSTLADFTTSFKSNPLGWTFGSGWNSAQSSGFWGAYGAIQYSNDPGSGYKSGTSSTSGTINIPAGTAFVEFDTGKFNNIAYEDAMGTISGYDTGVSMKFTFTGATPVVLAAKTNTVQFGVAVKVPVPAGVSGNVTATITIQNAGYSGAADGGFSVLKIRGVCN